MLVRMSGVIAIVGRPNVGKSALFNRLAGRRIAIVHDEPGVTRDRLSVEAEWRGHRFTLVDTGGIGLLRGEKTGDEIVEAAYAQVTAAIESAQLILLVVDVQSGLTPLDTEVAARLRAAGKPVIVAANKADNERKDLEAVEFAALGFEAVLPVSALQDRGIAQLMDLACQRLAALCPADVANASAVASASAANDFKIAIVGRPNVGKSSLINALTRSNRVIVSTLPGTTRDSVDVPLQIEANGLRDQFLLIDTAGIRKKRRVDDSVEFFSVTRAEQSIARCDLAVLVMDAESGITEQDKKIADLIAKHRKACLMVINKWDLAEVPAPPRPTGRPPRSRDAGNPLAKYADWVRQRMFFLAHAPVIFASAKTGHNLEQLLEAVRYVRAQLRQKIPTALLNRVLTQAVEQRQPVSRQGHRLRLYYATQVSQAPPTFLLFVNRKELFSPNYEKYLADGLRKAFGYEGCPMVLLPRSRPKTIPSLLTRGKKKHPASRLRRAKDD